MRLRIKKAMGHMDSSLFFLIQLSVEHPHPEIQVCGKGHPEEIGHLQPCSRFIHFPEGQNHQQDQNPQRDQPKESKSKSLQIKEDNAPEEIECQLYKNSRRLRDRALDAGAR